MIVRTYPEREFRRVVREKEYKPGSYFISITHANNGMESYVAPPGEKFLRLEFDDVLGPIMRSVPYSEAQAEEVAKFLEGIPENAAVHIHCAAGQSRSTGMGHAIADHFGGVIDHFADEVNPNKLVYWLTRQALEKACTKK